MLLRYTKDKFSTLTDAFRENKIPTYTEMIMGMPGETLESWKKGLELLASDAKIDSIYVYNCTVLPNAPMNDPNYKKYLEIRKKNLHKMNPIPVCKFND